MEFKHHFYTIHPYPGNILPPDVYVYLFTWYIANTETFQQVADRFGVTLRTAFNIINSVTQWMANVKIKSAVKWPDTQERNRISKSFESQHGLPGAVGVLDCTHIKVTAPSMCTYHYYNRRRFHSIQLLAVVDDRRRFIYVSCGEPGSRHEVYVLRQSLLYKNLTRFDRQSFIKDNQYLLGDLVYTPKLWLVSPYRKTKTMNDQQRKFNVILSATRVVLLEAFVLLKRRFRKLEQIETGQIPFINQCVMAACTMHNICIANNDLGEDFLEIDAKMKKLKELVLVNDKQPEHSLQESVKFEINIPSTSSSLVPGQPPLPDQPFFRQQPPMHEQKSVIKQIFHGQVLPSEQLYVLQSEQPYGKELQSEQPIGQVLQPEQPFSFGLRSVQETPLVDSSIYTRDEVFSYLESSGIMDRIQIN